MSNHILSNLGFKIKREDIGEIFASSNGSMNHQRGVPAHFSSLPSADLLQFPTDSFISTPYPTSGTAALDLSTITWIPINYLTNFTSIFAYEGFDALDLKYQYQNTFPLDGVARKGTCPLPDRKRSLTSVTNDSSAPDPYKSTQSMYDWKEDLADQGFTLYHNGPYSSCLNLNADIGYIQYNSGSGLFVSKDGTEWDGVPWSFRSNVIIVDLVGGGASGGSGGTKNDGTHSLGGPGGGGGGFVSFIIKLASGTIYKVTKGSGGAAPSGARQKGNNGTDSKFTDHTNGTTLATAGGGSGSQRGNGDTGNAGGTGGTATATTVANYCAPLYTKNGGNGGKAGDASLTNGYRGGAGSSISISADSSKLMEYRYYAGGSTPALPDIEYTQFSGGGGGGASAYGKGSGRALITTSTDAGIGGGGRGETLYTTDWWHPDSSRVHLSETAGGDGIVRIYFQPTSTSIFVSDE